MSKESLEVILNDISEIYGVDVLTEYKFSKDRRFRFDYFISFNTLFDNVSIRGLAIEYEGGVYGAGRHIRPLGFIRDCEKYNLALSLGVPVLRYTVEHLKDSSKVKEEIEQVINQFLKKASWKQIFNWENTVILLTITL